MTGPGIYILAIGFTLGALAYDTALAWKTYPDYLRLGGKRSRLKLALAMDPEYAFSVKKREK